MAASPDWILVLRFNSTQLCDRRYANKIIDLVDHTYDDTILSRRRRYGYYVLEMSLVNPFMENL